MKKTKIAESSNPPALIAAMTGLRSTAVQSYLANNNIDVEKLTQDLVSGILKPVDLSTAISGNPKNRYSMEIIKKYTSSVVSPNASESTIREDGGGEEITKENLVDYIMQYEDEGLDEETEIKFFAYLVKTGMAWQLQGSYGRAAQDLIRNGLIDNKGNILGGQQESVRVAENKVKTLLRKIVKEEVGKVLLSKKK